ncbi:sensor histidine kinase [Saccharothrix syringae]|uniref:sensor histidine kinase n=1 Tax=Saccharothrix syringae TaxID=103733 RepID=UPI000A012E0F|nr:histidine kinase dimerization/phospho-acceptor domain-containing protein [Saccharothrix syringae]
MRLLAVGGKFRPRGLREKVTLTATLVVAVPLVAVAVLAAVFLKNQAMRFDTAPVTDHDICVDGYFVEPGKTEATDTYKFWGIRCAVNDSHAILEPRRIDDMRVPGVADPDEVITASATYRSSALIPELSLWPFDDPGAMSYRVAQDTGEVSPPYPISGIEGSPAQDADPTAADVERDAAERRARLVAVQRTLDRRVLALAGGTLSLIGLLAAVVWLATGRVLRPVEAISGEMADITEHDLSRRVPVPRARNEIAELATTVNATLDRLETAIQDNRRFVADASHELRSPIAALRAELEIATAHPGLTDWPSVVDAALADTHRLQHLATDLLLLARLDHPTGHDDTVDLAELVREASARRTRHALTVESPEHPVPVSGRRALLGRLLGNLLDNAERHATTTVTVRLGVFDRFTRLDDARTRDTGGTGLGLPIARRIATNHAGTLHAEGGPGARLVARLPLKPHDQRLYPDVVFR